MSKLKLTSQHIGKMRHAIGLVGENIKRDKYTPYRNHFVITGQDSDWEELVVAGYATKRMFEKGRQSAYYVTNEGARILSGLYDIIISPLA